MRRQKLLGVTILIYFVFSIFAGCTNKGNIVDELTNTVTSETIEVLTTIEETTYPELKIEITSDENMISEYMDYYFIPDSEVLGLWEVVDLVSDIEYFDPSIQSFYGDFYWQNVEFLESGKTREKYSNTTYAQKWTKGYIVDEANKVIPAYIIKQIGGTNYIFIEWKSGDYVNRGQKPYYYVFKKASDPEPAKNVRYTILPYADVRNLSSIIGDLSLLNLEDFGESMKTLTFNKETIFPSGNKMPESDKRQPEYIMEAGKNPGLGVRSIHEQGITGKGVNVAILDQPLYSDHPEYEGKIVEYKDFGCQSESSMHGPLVTSLLAGESIGTAPGVKIYYAAVPSWKGDATYYADALEWIIEMNKTLPDNEKIKIVSNSSCPTPSDPRFTNGEKYLESVKRAEEAGILVLDCSPENRIIGSCEYDFDNPEDVTLCKPVNLTGNYPFEVVDRDILAPMMYRTTAEEYIKGEFSYQYSGNGGLSSAIPYAAGVLAMGWEIRPELTADRILQILFDTAYTDKNGNKFIYPNAFIDFLKHN